MGGSAGGAKPPPREVPERAPRASGGAEQRGWRRNAPVSAHTPRIRYPP